MKQNARCKRTDDEIRVREICCLISMQRCDTPTQGCARAFTSDKMRPNIISNINSSRIDVHADKSPPPYGRMSAFPQDVSCRSPRAKLLPGETNDASRLDADAMLASKLVEEPIQRRGGRGESPLIAT